MLMLHRTTHVLGWLQPLLVRAAGVEPAQRLRTEGF